MFTNELVLQIIKDSNEDFIKLLNLLYFALQNYVGEIPQVYIDYYTELFGVCLECEIDDGATNSELSEYITKELNSLIEEIRSLYV